MKCYWGHTTDPSMMRTCTDGKNPVCPVCCHNHCFKEYAGMYTACAQRGWPVWPPAAAGIAGPRTAEAACYWKHTTDKSLMRVCTDGSNPVCPECCHRHCPTSYPDMYNACRSRGFPVWTPLALQQMAQGGYQQPQGYCAPQQHGYVQPQGYGAPQQYGNQAPQPTVKCYWGHTTDRSKMKTCTDGSNPVCPECCHKHCLTQYASMYNSCKANGWPVWPPAGGSYSPAQPQAPYGGVGPYGSEPAPTLTCYWGHTTDRSRLKTCTDGKNPVCPECCHKHCPNEYPGMYSSCEKKGWPVWPPQSAGLSGAAPVQCYWHHTNDRSKMKTCTDGSNPVCPECCHINCPQQYPGMYQECARKNWPVWLPQSHGPAATADIQCYWHHTTNRLNMKTCADGSSLVCPECCHIGCPKDTPDWQEKCRAQGFPVWPQGSRGSTQTVQRPVASVSQSSTSGFLIAPAKLQDWPWDVEILQDGFVVSTPSGNAGVKRRPFTIRLRMPEPRTVRINTLDNDANFKLVQPGARVDSDKSFTPRPGGLTQMHCFSAGTGTVDADYFLTRLVVSDGGHQEIVFRSYNDHRWSKVDVTDQRAVFERRVLNIRLVAQGYDEPVERYKGARLYLTVLVKHHDDPEIHDDELRRITIEFQ